MTMSVCGRRRYPPRPRANPLFFDSEIAAIRFATGLQLRGRAKGLAHGLSLSDQQLQVVSESVTFLVPWHDLSGARLAPSAGLSLVARAMDGIEDAADLTTDLSNLPHEAWFASDQSDVLLTAARSATRSLGCRIT